LPSTLIASLTCHPRHKAYAGRNARRSAVSAGG
jgi:hypothetical protein